MIKRKTDVSTLKSITLNTSMTLEKDSSIDDNELSKDVLQRIRNVYNDLNCQIKIIRITRNGDGIIENLTFEIYS